MMNANRLNYIDTAKGIGIILVILAHNPLPTDLGNAIYAFHMPLFFIISGYFLRQKSLADNIKSGYKLLLTPYLGTLLICFLLLLLKNVLKGEYTFPLLNDNNFLIESFAGHFVSFIWFLVALFWGRIILCAFHKYMSVPQALLSILICFVICVNLHINGKTIDNYVPFYFVDGIVGTAFMEIGYLIKRYGLMEKKLDASIFILSAFILIMGMSVNVSLRRLNFPLGAINLVTSSIIVIAYLFIIKMAYNINYIRVIPNNSFITKQGLRFRGYIEHLGKISLVILCCHQIEGLTGIFAFMTRLPQYSIGPIKVFITLIIAHIVCHIPKVRLLLGFNKK